MIPTALSLPVLALLLMSASAADPRTPTPLPQAITVRLDTLYPGWCLALTSGASANIGSREPPDKPISVLQADFDGNGLKDYATLIEYPVSYADGHSSWFSRVLVFLRTPARFRTIPLTDALLMPLAGRLHLRPVSKGTSVYDLDANHHVICKHDAIEVGFDGRGPCTTFVYRRDKFVSIWTCD
jgi:hypothetical protein